MRQFRNVLFSFFLCFVLYLSFQTLWGARVGGKVKWITTMKQYYNIDSTERARKPIYMDLYTDWCGWCKVMDKKTFMDDSVAHYLNQYFIPIKLNAETKDKIMWRGVNFQFDDRYNVNAFAVFLTNGNLGFPTSVVIDTDNTFDAIPGYLKVSDIEPILKFYRIPKSERIALTQYIKEFKSMWGR